MTDSVKLQEVNLADSAKLYYKTCRENASLTHEQAISLLNIAEVATLSKYENGHIVPDQQMVANMVMVYRVPSLAIWHIRHTNPALVHYLPEITELQTVGDVYLLGTRAIDNLCDNMEKIKSTVCGNMTADEQSELKTISAGLRKTVNMVTSLKTFIDDAAQFL